MTMMLNLSDGTAAQAQGNGDLTTISIIYGILWFLFLLTTYIVLIGSGALKGRESRKMLLKLTLIFVTFTLLGVAGHFVTKYIIGG